jgi:hypothetical protein
MRGLFGTPASPPPPVDPPDVEPALVALHPRRPLGSGSVALEPPAEPEEVDARATG